jgi:20S proteasome alpha/beta subunit
MTIAVGIRAYNGIVIAADSEESWDIFKFDQGKIKTAYHHDESSGKPKTCSCAITGSGASGYLKAIQDRLATTVIDTDAAVELEELRQLIEKDLSGFYNQHVIPFSADPFRDRTDFGLILGASNSRGHELWSTDLSTVTRERAITSGIGGPYARVVLDRILQAGEAIDVSTAAIMAAYAIFGAKETTGGCGKHTHLICLQKGRMVGISEAVMAEIESLFKEHFEIEKQLFHLIFGDSTAKWRNTHANSVRQQMNRIKAGISERVQAGPQPIEVSISPAPSKNAKDSSNC